MIKINFFKAKSINRRRPHQNLTGLDFGREPILCILNGNDDTETGPELTAFLWSPLLSNAVSSWNRLAFKPILSLWRICYSLNEEASTSLIYKSCWTNIYLRFLSNTCLALAAYMELYTELGLRDQTYLDSNWGVAFISLYYNHYKKNILCKMTLDKDENLIIGQKLLIILSKQRTWLLSKLLFRHSVIYSYNLILIFSCIFCFYICQFLYIISL